MTSQITVRIADDVAAFLDDQARASGESRAALITKALRREQRRQVYAEEAIRLAALPPLTPEEQIEDDTWASWAVENAGRLSADLD